MENFDFGVGLAFWLMILSTVLCVVYGYLKWNKDGETMSNSQRHWAHDEDAINNDL